MMRVLLTALTALAAAPAAAGGFYLQEQSPLGVGRAFAGAAAIADSADTIFYNPAGMTRLPGNRLEVGTHFLFIDSQQRNLGSTRSLPGGAGAIPTGGADGGNPFDIPAVIPSGYGSFQFKDTRLWIGLGLSAPFGLVVDYNDGWFGRYDSVRSEVFTLNLQPSAAFAITDRISIGGGVNIQRARAQLTAALPNLSPLQPDGLVEIVGKDFSFGWNAGVLADLGPVRLGAHYRSNIDHDLQGALTVTGLLGPLAGSNGGTRGVAPFSTPDIASVAAVASRGKLRALASATWTNWSRFERIQVTSNVTGAIIADSEQDYRDTWSYSGALEYDMSEKMTLRVGSMFDETPTRDATRTTRVPDGNRIWASGGMTFRPKPGLALNASYAHVFVATEQLNRTDTVFAGTPAAIVINTRSENRGNVDIVAGSLSLSF